MTQASQANIQSVIEGLNLDLEQDVNESFNRTVGRDDLLGSLLLKLRSHSPTSRALAQSVFDSVCYFFTDSSDKTLRKLSRLAVNRLEGVAGRRRIMDAMDGDLSGLELSNATGTQFAVFTPDASEPGRVRYTLFDAFGFFSHSTFDSYEEALQGAWQAGLKVTTKNMLQTLSLTEVWAVGSAKTSMIQQINLGKFSHGQCRN